MTIAEQSEVWGPYVSYDDVARFDYGRLLWRQPAMRQRLLAHWLDERHPHRERFLARRDLVDPVRVHFCDGAQHDAKAFLARLLDQTIVVVPHEAIGLALVEDILATDDSPVALDRRLRERGTSLRAAAREIPPVFGSFFK